MEIGCGGGTESNCSYRDYSFRYKSSAWVLLLPLLPYLSMYVHDNGWHREQETKKHHGEANSKHTTHNFTLLTQISKSKLRHANTCAYISLLVHFRRGTLSLDRIDIAIDLIIL
jgi:hypothetical protein